MLAVVQASALRVRTGLNPRLLALVDGKLLKLLLVAIAEPRDVDVCKAATERVHCARCVVAECCFGYAGVLGAGDVVYVVLWVLVAQVFVMFWWILRNGYVSNWLRR